ncbi:hypothetical protein [Halapricum desulfuricans]|uniref:Putative membrane protein n=1 Tax=Halapricum desulfuricans TaxID=2841257 RepID=A0A897MW45_9EURY|nr:hypothetical protein [Halapricum desulfuricans]QSG06340.1 putative membrane protein [Halapricum desulfuricans]
MTGWEDPILAFGGWVLNLAAMATVLNKDAAVPRTHSVPVFLTMILYLAAYWSLGLTGAAWSVVAASVIWLYIIFYRNPKDNDN